MHDFDSFEFYDTCGADQTECEPTLNATYKETYVPKCKKNDGEWVCKTPTRKLNLVFQDLKISMKILTK